MRRELLDRILIVNERHLRRILAVYLQHFNTARPHRTLGQLTPAQAENQPPSDQPGAPSDPPQTDP
ncbi:MAG TPA: integrase core domain-containing protein [Pseudonocardiaceae bacterium]